MVQIICFAFINSTLAAPGFSNLTASTLVIAVFIRNIVKKNKKEIFHDRGVKLYFEFL